MLGTAFKFIMES